MSPLKAEEKSALVKRCTVANRENVSFDKKLPWQAEKNRSHYSSIPLETKLSLSFDYLTVEDKGKKWSC